MNRRQQQSGNSLAEVACCDLHQSTRRSPTAAQQQPDRAYCAAVLCRSALASSPLSIHRRLNLMILFKSAETQEWLGSRRAGLDVRSSLGGVQPEARESSYIEIIFFPRSADWLPIGLAGAESAGFLSRLIGNDEAVLRDEKREAALQDCKAPLTIVRVGKLVDSPGGTSEIQVAQVIWLSYTGRQKCILVFLSFLRPLFEALANRIAILVLVVKVARLAGKKSCVEDEAHLSGVALIGR